MEPNNPIHDMMERTMKNLEVIEKLAEGEKNCANKSCENVFEVTQLVNSFLAALAHPWEEYKKDLKMMKLDTAVDDGWPILKEERKTDTHPENLGDQIRFIRNAIAHGNIEFHSEGEDKKIISLHLWNLNEGNSNWGTIISIEYMKMLLKMFLKVVNELPEHENTCTRRRPK